MLGGIGDWDWDGGCISAPVKYGCPLVLNCVLFGWLLSTRGLVAW